ncbi:hypothetical protein RN001_011743 [Aquatica leii]|uniref:Major facilitator superfamily (MFS) profile domain-containing protein n=1 Tax=Aquatica leii TaxID=1421715 RepID=A0AAN7P4T7_9COLE|nr:hypothetical protein RN001_011743 [Aquatica leii]
MPSTIIQIVATLTGTLLTLSDGMQSAWTSPIVIKLTSPSSPIKIQDSDVSLLENIYMIGALFGLTISIFVLDIIGRKNTMLMVGVSNIIIWFVIGFATSVIVLTIARFFAGVANNVNFIASTAYIGEISEKTIRGRLGSLLRGMLTFGMLIIYSVGPYVSIFASSMVGVGIIVLHLLTFPFMPESPYFLLMKNRKDQARKSLKMLRRLDDVEEELEYIEETIERERYERRRPLDLIKIKTNRRALLILIVLNFAQQFSGNTIIYMNIHEILLNASFDISPNIAAIAYSALMLASCLLFTSLVDKIGRRFFLCASCLLTTISLFLLAAYFVAQNRINVEGFLWIPVFAIMLYGGSFTMGLLIVPTILTSELFPTNIKSIAVSVCSGTFLISGSLSLLLYHGLKTYGMYVPFFVFAFCTLAAGVFSYFFVFETKNKTLAEIQAILEHEVYGKKEGYGTLNENENYESD